MQVDANVTDSHGKPVSGLKAADFQILQDGKPQVITNFSYISVKPSTADSAPTRVAVAKKGGTPGPPPPPTTLSMNKVVRTIALVVDDLGLSFSRAPC